MSPSKSGEVKSKEEGYESQTPYGLGCGFALGGSLYVEKQQFECRKLECILGNAQPECDRDDLRTAHRPGELFRQCDQPMVPSDARFHVHLQRGQGRQGAHRSLRRYE
jgi:hypothetical protein